MSNLYNCEKLFFTPPVQNDGMFFYLPNIKEFHRKEIDFHDTIHAEEEEAHQLNSVRNKYYHEYYKKWIYRLPVDALILEIRVGSGVDAIPIIARGYHFIASDISTETIRSFKNIVESRLPGVIKNVIFLVADGQRLPINNEIVEATYMVASLHHFKNQGDLLSEMLRITKPGGLMIFAMEPSRFMMSFVKLFARIKRLRIYQGHSEADETHSGYSTDDINKLCQKSGVKVLEVKRVWIIQGLLHYGLEGIFRLVRLKRRIRLPKIIELMFLRVDEVLLKIPLVNRINWHWIVVLQKE